MNALRLHLGVVALALIGDLLHPAPALAQTGMTEMKAGNLPVTLVYPTEARNTAHAFGPFRIEAALGAAPRRGNGRLVVLSHGSAGSAIAHFDLARTLADAGFVVATPEHEGDNWRDKRLAGPESWKRRPGEITQTIDAVLKDARFAPLLKGDRVGVHGMSAGGVTGLTLAGGEWSMARLISHCVTHASTDAGFCFYDLRGAAREERAAVYARGDAPPGADALQGGAAARDPRVAAIALTVPLAAVFTPESLARIQLPVGVMEASADKLLLPRFHSSYVLAGCARCTSLGPLQGAGHFDVLSPWPEAISKPLAQVPGWGPEPGFDRAALPASYRRIAAFFAKELK